ncbi:hypothetical protein [Legionella jordanis]|uniref:Uncharacterized protein n=1 Tax=Legionella jordanis TaxID=456 RepID=A0A0W0VCC4_9GAMM|nr:hypothetical protein [Legionella jordanis]KTD17781.1 hypothetical protein Ljor_2087 [Legionella jordanis]RMX02514.1 hypothetical protein EAW55_09735 [Legionella jordanis]RMX21639.1 hypothetical protein EAS68_02460 [Legionella jordanis]VEH11283.1 Uncharacterised protein [Legionella jordanis]HAT8713750.1 hypothetical protein [Legionella jordanis]
MKFIGKEEDVTVPLKKLNVSLSAGNILEVPKIAADEAIVCAVNMTGIKGKAELYLCENLEDMQQLQNKADLGMVLGIDWYTVKKPPTLAAKVDITGLDKGSVLLALVNNARKSPAVQYVTSQFPSSSQILETFDLVEANKVLLKNAVIGYVGPVNIKMNFKEDVLHAGIYNQTHCVPGSSCLSADKVITELRDKTRKAEVSLVQPFTMWPRGNKNSNSAKRADSSPENDSNEFGFKKGFLN